VSDLDQPITSEWLTEIGWLDRSEILDNFCFNQWEWYSGTVTCSRVYLPHIKTRGQLLLAMHAMGDTAPGTEIIERQLRAAEYVERYAIVAEPGLNSKTGGAWVAFHHDSLTEPRADTWADAVIALGEHLDQQGATNVKN
jgi:hypothetical protein